ncbi:MAG: carboxypeptidase-like regulatory domain-containing protein [Clostridiales bacterium]|nr:carboxypeptidase-like regulatory domain-containing protein [Clostridiales bacterium]
MSVQTEIARIENAKEALKTAINAKGGSLTDESIESYAEAVNKLETKELKFLTAGFAYSFAEVSGFFVTDGEGETSEYSIADIIKDGEAAGKVKDAGKYELSISNGAETYTAAFVITKRNIDETDITPIGTLEYIGEALTPEIDITLNGVPLTKDEDYTVVYADNVNAGTATVTVTGIGNFTGEVSVTFEIKEQLYYATGTIYMTSGRPAVMLTVTLSGTTVSGESVSLETQTDISGVWIFTDLRNGTYTVTYNSEEHDVELIALS